MLDEYYAIMTMSIPTSMKTPEMLFFFYLIYATGPNFLKFTHALPVELTSLHY